MNRQVVIIDNDVDDLEIIESIIKDVDPSALCLSFVFPDEALRILTDELDAPDFIFIDVNMSRKTGPECLRHLLDHPKFQNTKIVMFSGVMPPAVGNSLVQLGAFDYFQKPLLDSAYRQQVGRIFNKDRSQWPTQMEKFYD